MLSVRDELQSSIGFLLLHLVTLHHSKGLLGDGVEQLRPRGDEVAVISREYFIKYLVVWISFGGWNVLSLRLATTLRWNYLPRSDWISRLRPSPCIDSWGGSKYVDSLLVVYILGGGLPQVLLVDFAWFLGNFLCWARGPEGVWISDWWFHHVVLIVPMLDHFGCELLTARVVVPLCVLLCLGFLGSDLTPFLFLFRGWTTRLGSRWFMRQLRLPVVLWRNGWVFLHGRVR